MIAHLELIENQSRSIPINLYSAIPLHKSIIDKNLVLYSDRTYEMHLNILDSSTNDVQNLDLDDFTKFNFYINDVRKECILKNGNLIFSNNDRVFLDCFGYAQISLDIEIQVNDEIKNFEFYSNYIEVAIRKGITSNSIRKMVKYISENYEQFLHGQNKTSFDQFDIKESVFRSMNTQINILKEIISEYQINLNYFRNNIKGSTMFQERVEKFEKLKRIQKNTILYISSHPNELEEVGYNTGIRMNEKNYQPKRVLMQKNVFSTDIYENQVVLSFLYFLYGKLNSTIEMLEIKISENKKNFSIDPEYVLSSYEIQKDILESYSRHINELKVIAENIRVLFLSYKKILKCNLLVVQQIPKATKIFLSINHYYRIFSCIIKWFQFGDYSFNCENMMLSFLGCSKIYEYYVLLNILNFFRTNNYTKKEFSKQEYPITPEMKYKNTESLNTFFFEKNNLTTAVYYQPVIYCKKENISNEIGLYRNTSVSLLKATDNEIILLKFKIARIHFLILYVMLSGQP